VEAVPHHRQRPCAGTRGVERGHDRGGGSHRGRRPAPDRLRRTLPQALQRRRGRCQRGQALDDPIGSGTSGWTRRHGPALREPETTAAGVVKRCDEAGIRGSAPCHEALCVARDLHPLLVGAACSKRLPTSSSAQGHVLQVAGSVDGPRPRVARAGRLRRRPGRRVGRELRFEAQTDIDARADMNPRCQPRC